MGCAECHDHKFDPYTTKDFYSLAAFFADLQETAVGRQQQTPLMDAAMEAEVKRLDAAIAQAKAALAAVIPSNEALADWEKKLQERIARDPGTAKKEKIPGNVLNA